VRAFVLGGQIAVPQPITLITEDHINRFQNRASFHFALSYAILIVILALFGFAIYVFLFAQQIDRSKGSVEVVQELLIGKSKLAEIVSTAEQEADVFLSEYQAGTTSLAPVLDAAKAFNDDNIRLHLFDEQIRLMNDSGFVANIDAPRAKEEFDVIANGKNELKAGAEKVLAIAQNQYNVGTAAKSDVLLSQRFVSEADLEQQLYQRRALAAAPAAELKQSASNLDTIELVRTSLVRFGGIAVILFLISLLTPIYRYNVRLGTFYQARADILLLSRDTHVSNFPEMTRMFTPVYGFEQEPKTPVDSIATFAKEAASIARKG
jgi:hypothetical protein